MNLSNSSENWFFILIQVMKTIESEWFLHQNEQQNSKGTNESNYTHKNNYLIQAQWILLNLGIIQQHSLCPWQTIVNYREIFRDPFVLSKNNFYMTPIKTYRIEVSNNKY